ncbi:hypothetical protein [Pleomorphovibrio marinus]|uniref:hypothetical protein n=1 Tax=Pleomorphovibrio marinus TaxID=2164132 RepID=UPI000E09FB07|nr:hypothetical protein [Pleomorphovibrio marinus]
MSKVQAPSMSGHRVVGFKYGKFQGTIDRHNWALRKPGQTPINQKFWPYHWGRGKTGAHHIPHGYSFDEISGNFIKGLKPLDSIDYLSLREQIEIKLSGVILLNKMEKFIEVLNLYPLKYQGGCFKLVYKYNPKENIVIGTRSFKLPHEINVNKRLNKPFESNETYICY